MQPWNIKTVILWIWNQNFTQLVSTKSVTKNPHLHSYSFIKWANYNKIVPKNCGFFVKWIDIWKINIRVWNEYIDSLYDTNQLVTSQRIYFIVLCSICNSYGVLLNNLFHATAFLKRWHHWIRRKFTWEKHETFD